MTNIENAKMILTSGGYSCVLCKDSELFTSSQKGIKPLVDYYKSNCSFNGFSAADKIVGKATAFLYLLLGVSAVYADVISSPALELLSKNGVYVGYDTKTDYIINRQGNGICPFENAVKDIEDPDTAYGIILDKMKELSI